MSRTSTFAFRIIIDIALKALSSAINDPTTAVIAIDQLQPLLRTVANRNLHDERILDGDGRLRVNFRIPNWEDFVHLTFSEIHLYVARHFARRLRTMIEKGVAERAGGPCPGAARRTGAARSCCRAIL